jgi:lipid A disaccharide synthetase
MITLVDTPGSQDTESNEVDISNGLGILRAVRQTKGVRLVILFSYLKLGARGEEIKKLLAFYAGMLKNLEKNLGAFSFFFTHVPEEIKIANLRAILEDGYNQLTG